MGLEPTTRGIYSAVQRSTESSTKAAGDGNLILLMIDWLIVCFINWLTDWLFDCFINWLTDWLFDSLIVLLIDWLIHWLIDWLIEVFNE